MGIIQQKIRSGSLKLYHDYRSGTLLDFSGNSNDGTVTGTLPFTKQGVVFNRITGSDNPYIDVNSNLGITANLTVVAVIKPNQAPDGIGSTVANVYDYDSGSDNGWQFGDGYGSDDHFAFTVWNAGANAGANYVNFFANHGGQRVCVVGTYEPSTAVNLYVDSIVKGTDVTSVPASIALPDTEKFRAGLRSDDAATPYDTGAFDGLIECILVFNETFTATEVSQITADLKEIRYPTKTITKSSTNKLQNSSTVTSHWIMEPQGGTIVDDTGAGNDASITGSPTFIDTVLGPGAHLVDDTNGFDTGSDWALTSALTLGAWVKLDDWGGGNLGNIFNNFKTTWRFTTGGDKMQFSSDGATFVTSATDSIKLNSLTFVCVTRTAAGIANFYVDGVLSGSADQDSGTPENGTSNVFIGNNDNDTAALEGTIIEPFALVGTVETVAQILARYELGAKQVQFKTDWGAYATEQNITAGFIGNTLWERSSGTWKISPDTIDGTNVKVLENVAAGIAYAEVSQLLLDSTEAAYGTWEFWVNKAADSATSINFIASNLTPGASGNYGLVLDTDESIDLIERGVATLFTTAASYISISTWYGFKITRSGLGVFTVYIKGGAFGNDWTIIDVSGGSGTNPITDTTTITSIYVVFDLDAGDKIAIADSSGNHSLVKTVGVI